MRNVEWLGVCDREGDIRVIFKGGGGILKCLGCGKVWGDFEWFGDKRVLIVKFMLCSIVGGIRGDLSYYIGNLCIWRVLER